jgi:hypothetical protein
LHPLQKCKPSRQVKESLCSFELFPKIPSRRSFFSLPVSVGYRKALTAFETVETLDPIAQSESSGFLLGNGEYRVLLQLIVGHRGTDRNRLGDRQQQRQVGILNSLDERDGPPICAPTHRGFGTTVITKMVEMSLDGETVLELFINRLDLEACLPTEERSGRLGNMTAHFSQARFSR